MKQIFDINQCTNRTVMYCENEQEGAIFQEYLDSVGRRWAGGYSYLDPEQAWDPTYPCYRFSIGTHGSLEFYSRRGFTILRFSDFDWGTPDVFEEDNADLDSFLSSYCPLQEEVSQ